ncbi:hypothetical protein [Pedobacter cryophilus]|uniref:Uncharacterized protein n=1 Tax=Pedobacter cryophilus TaxID=2571271 RepID=A0A4U1C1J7_9SPHI|nr:hypothetical protein [Pedobacter cryophilus]TKB99091.1 hypothetical protein FA046_08255 [Pedobacter cryophilus]
MDPINLNDKAIHFKSHKDIPTLLFSVLWIIITSIYYLKDKRPITDLGFEEIILQSIAILMTIFFTYKSIWSLTGKLSLFINTEQLIIRKHFMGLYISHSYSLKNIQNLKIISEKTNTYWGINGFRIYDRNELLLYFHYNNKSILLGKGISHFNPELLIKELKNKKKSY